MELSSYKNIINFIQFILKFPNEPISLKIEYGFCLITFGIIFLLGFYGFILHWRNLLLMLLNLELMLLSINLNFIFFSLLHQDIHGQIFALFILTVVSAESAIGFALFTLYYRNTNTISINYFLQTRG